MTSRGRLTRNRLKAAARAALGVQPIADVKISDVTTRAGVAIGLFYRYFPDLAALLAEVIEDWAEEVFAEDKPAAVNAPAPAPAPAKADFHAFAALKAAILRLVARIDASPGLFAAAVGATGAVPQAGEAWRVGIERWLKQRMRGVNDAFPGNAFGVEHLLVGLGGLLEGFLIARYIRGAPLAMEAAGPPEEIAELLALAWHRAIWLENPPAALIEDYGYVAKIGAD